MKRFAAGAMLAIVVAVMVTASGASASPQARIVGGEQAFNPWPAQARLTFDGEFICGGTLVAPRWVLTAAHCVTGSDGSLASASHFAVTLGSTKVDGNGGTDHEITKIVRHPSYSTSTMANDAALLRLQNPSQAAPLPLISEDSLWAAAPGSTARVLGWGDTSQGGDPAEDLRQVDMPIVDDTTCGAPEANGDALIPAVMLCAGLAEGGVDSCQGDSGGPLMVDTGAGAETGADPSSEGWKLAGIVSFGFGCAQPNKYGVYTELANSSIRSWIYQTIDGLPVGLQNPSFEQPLKGGSDWVATVYDAASNVVRSGSGACPDDVDAFDAPRRVCRVGTDSFEIEDAGVTKEVTVSPLDGSAMLRLGGPFRSNAEAQEMDRYVARQSFIVDPSEPLLHLNYNMMTFDYTNFDELRLRVRLFDDEGDVIYNKVVGSFGPGGDISFKSTGWRSANIDLSPYAGEAVTLRLDSGGTQDHLYGFWTYVDAGTVPEVVGQLGAPEVPEQTPGGQPVLYQVQEDANGLTYYNFAVSSANAFTAAGQCLDLKLAVPIQSGAGVASNVSLLLDQTAGGSQQVPLEDPDANGIWTVPAGSDGICVQKGTLYVVFTLTENGVSQDFVVPVGGVTLIDPQGVVYDRQVFEDGVASGLGEEEARADAALGGATVTLERRTGEAFQVVLSGDPGISPNVNPQITPSSGPSKGLYQWDVAAGEYRVRVSLPGYVEAISKVVSVPPPVTDLHIAMEREKLPTGPSGSGGGAAGTAASASAQPPAAAGVPPARRPCAGLKGKALQRCRLRLRRRAARAKCGKLSGKAKADCAAKANSIGRKGRGAGRR